MAGRFWERAKALDAEHPERAARLRRWARMAIERAEKGEAPPPCRAADASGANTPTDLSDSVDYDSPAVAAAER